MFTYSNVVLLSVRSGASGHVTSFRLENNMRVTFRTRSFTQVQLFLVFSSRFSTDGDLIYNKNVLRTGFYPCFHLQIFMFW